MTQPIQSGAQKGPDAPQLTALVAEGRLLGARVREAAVGKSHAHVADELTELADELDDILFRLAGLTTRRP